MDLEDSYTHRPEATAASKPTGFLCGDSAQFSLLMIHSLIMKGFALKDVQAMVSSSELYSSKMVLKRILGKSLRAARRQIGPCGDSRLNPQQSAVAYQFAEILEVAIGVFGKQKMAEDWLGRPSVYLNGEAPVDIVDEPIGFRAVKQYLERIEYGVYQ